MAEDKIITENDDPEIVEVDELPAPGAEPNPEPESQGDDDEEDSRLADSEDDDDDAPKPAEDTRARKNRLNRKKARQVFIDRTLAEVTTLREQNAEFARRLSAVEGSAIDTSEAQVDSRLQEARNDKLTAERILAKAVEAGNGQDVTTALELRDNAIAVEQSLSKVKDSFAEARKPKTGANPVVVTHSNEWKASNAAWYGINMEATKLANQIDAQVAADGYKPETTAYWQELTRRVKTAFTATDERTDTPARKKAPPQGRSTEHAPASTRTQVYLTPDRKQAIIDAGAWDDPKERARFVKAYQKYDRDQSAGQ